MLMMFLAAAQAGQVAKFEKRVPEVVYETAARLEDVERCLIRTFAPPQVYRQPDRLNDVTIVWPGVSLNAGNATARVDLQRSPVGTKVTAWLTRSIVEGCAPKQG